MIFSRHHNVNGHQSWNAWGVMTTIMEEYPESEKLFLYIVVDRLLGALYFI